MMSSLKVQKVAKVLAAMIGIPLLVFGWLYYVEGSVRYDFLTQGIEIAIDVQPNGEEKVHLFPAAAQHTTEQQVLVLYKEYAHLFPEKAEITVKNFGNYVIVYINGYGQEDVQAITMLARSLASIGGNVKPETEGWYMEKRFTVRDGYKLQWVNLRYQAERPK